MNATTATGWTGWHRQDERSPWRQIVHGDDETRVFNQLLDLVRGGDKCILPSGADPNTTPPQPRPRRF